MLNQLKDHSADADLSKKERRKVKRAFHHELVKRSALLKIAAAWIITVPVSGIRAPGGDVVLYEPRHYAAPVW